MYVHEHKAEPLMAEQSDEEIVKLVRNGFQEMFGIIYERYYQKVFRLAFGMTGHREQATDLTQEIFFKIFKSLHSFNEHSSFSTWQYRIALNHCLNHSRKNAYANKHISIGDQEHCSIVYPNTHDLPESESKVLSLEIQRALKDALLHLKPFERAIILLRDIEGLSYAEIAEHLKCSTGTVASRLSRARIKLELRVRHLKGKI
jgi:RNA polymerase sigma-70 factor (ECF subfamily)